MDINELRTAPQTGNLPAVFNPDAWHAMQERDDQLIKDGLLHGYTGKEFVYEFEIQGKKIVGVSVVGARELAAHYGGIKARIVASVDKTGSLFVFKSFEPMNVAVQMIPQLADGDDFYEVVMEITDIKTGNSIQVRKKETKVERKRNGDTYARPHFDVIAESKAFRNGVLSVIPQSVIKEFEAHALKAGKVGAEKTIDQMREGVLAFATKNAIGLDRQLVNQLTYAEINGLGSALSQGIAQFREAAGAIGIFKDAPTDGAAAPRQATSKPPAVARKNTQTKEPQPPTDKDGEAVKADDIIAHIIAQIQAAKSQDAIDLQLDIARSAKLSSVDLQRVSQSAANRQEVLNVGVGTTPGRSGMD